MRRKLIFTALTLALFMAGFSLAAWPALAELRTITVTLVGGQQIVTTVDVPPGTPTNQIKLPEISAPIAGIKDGTPKRASSQGSNGTTGTSGPSGSTGPSGSSGTSGPTGNGGQKGRKKQSRNSPGKFLNETNAQPEVESHKSKPGAIRSPDGAPTDSNPTLTLGLPGPAPVGVPNFVINKFRIPPFLLPIYQAAGTQYGLRWDVLAAIHTTE